MGIAAEQLGLYLRSARTSKGLTLRDVERETGVSNAYLSQLEGGKIKQPSPAVLQRLTDFLEADFMEVMRLAGHPVPVVSQPSQTLQNLARRIGRVTPDEADKIAEYVEFLRSKRK
ncbi:MAG: helix-turn-helix transcriptional regulator [Meiothermus sp.]|nr:helix-turn-helix transcriptional regulator [Meiothermus sp.]